MASVVTLILVSSVANSPIASFEVLMKGDIASTVALLASGAADAVLLLPLVVGAALGYLQARQAEGETLEGIVRAAAAP